MGMTERTEIQTSIFAEVVIRVILAALANGHARGDEWQMLAGMRAEGFDAFDVPKVFPDIPGGLEEWNIGLTQGRMICRIGS
jgi:hypothetical protein